MCHPGVDWYLPTSFVYLGISESSSDDDDEFRGATLFRRAITITVVESIIRKIETRITITSI